MLVRQFELLSPVFDLVHRQHGIGALKECVGVTGLNDIPFLQQTMHTEQKRTLSNVSANSLIVRG